MAFLTEDAKFLGARGAKVLLRADYVSAHPQTYALPGVELLIYHADRYEHVLQTYGVFLGYRDAIDLLARLDAALREYDHQHPQT